MRAKLGVPLVIVMSAVLAGIIGMGAASGQTVLHLVIPGADQKIHDINHYGGLLSPGDRVAVRGPLNDAEGARAGTGYGDCMVQRTIKGPETGLWNCTYVLDLGDGDLILQGLDPRGPGSYEMAVLGGTGAYAGASGDATFTDFGGETGEVDSTDIVIRLSN